MEPQMPLKKLYFLHVGRFSPTSNDETAALKEPIKQAIKRHLEQDRTKRRHSCLMLADILPLFVVFLW